MNYYMQQQVQRLDRQPEEIDRFVNHFLQNDSQLKSQIKSFEVGGITYFTSHASVKKSTFSWPACFFIVWQQDGQIMFGQMQESRGFPFIPNKAPNCKHIISFDGITNIKSQSDEQIEVQAGSKMKFRFFDTYLKNRWLFILTALLYAKIYKLGISLQKILADQILQYYLADHNFQLNIRTRQVQIEFQAITRIGKRYLDLQKQISAQINQLQGQLNARTAQINQLQGQLNARNDFISEISAALERPQEGFLQRIQELKKQNYQLNQKSKNLLSTQFNYLSTIVQKEEKLSTISNEIQSLKACLQKKQEQIQNLQNQLLQMNNLRGQSSSYSQQSRQNQLSHINQRQLENSSEIIQSNSMYSQHQRSLSGIQSNINHKSLQSRNVQSYLQSEHSSSSKDFKYFLPQQLSRQEQPSLQSSFSLLRRDKFGNFISQVPDNDRSQIDL